MRTPTRHIVTCEYPPRVGGVADHTSRLAEALADAGEAVHVWCPPVAARALGHPRVTVHALPDCFGARSRLELDAGLSASAAPRRIFVQWVPHGYGRRSMNVGFCRWVLRRARRHGDRVEVMIHEPYLAFDAMRLKQSAAAIVHRGMLAVLLAAAQRVWLSTPSFEPLVRPYGFGKALGYEWLPVPNPVEPSNDREQVMAIRQRLGSPVVAHFGMFNPLVTAVLVPVAERILVAHGTAHLLLIGAGGTELAATLCAGRPELAPRIAATGALEAASLSAHIQAADVFVQPYPDGVTARRTSAICLLAHARAIVTTSGYLTEPLWAADRAVRLAPAGDAAALCRHALELLERPLDRSQLAARACTMHAARFDPQRAVGLLRAAS